MVRPTRSTETEIAAGLAKLPGWIEKDGKLHRSYRFADFVTAFGFMTGAALIAERSRRGDTCTHEVGSDCPHFS